MAKKQLVLKKRSEPVVVEAPKQKKVVKFVKKQPKKMAPKLTKKVQVPNESQDPDWRKKKWVVWKKVAKPVLTRPNILRMQHDDPIREIYRSQLSTYYRRPGYVQKILVVQWKMELSDNHPNNVWENAYLVWVPPDLQESEMRPQVVALIEDMGDFDQYEYWIEKEAISYEIQNVDADVLSLDQIKLRASPFLYHGFSSIDKETISKYPGLCVILAILATVQTQKRYEDWTVQQLVKEFLEIGVDIVKNGASAEQIRIWCDRMHTNEISMKAFDPLGNLLLSHEPPNDTHVCLVFILNDGHCNPVLDLDLKKSILRLDKVKFKSVDIEYNFETSRMVENEADIDKLLRGESDIPNKVILLKKTNLRDEALLATKYSEIYLNQFKFDNHNNLVSFVHPKTHVLFVGSPDYDAVKYACEHLTKTVDNLEKFIFRDQRLTTLSTALYEYFSREEVPLSYISEDYQAILKNHYARPLRFVKEDVSKFDTNLVSIDCKSSFDRAVLRMSEPIPVYTLFDHVEEYKGGDIVLGEYLLDEFFIHGIPVPSQTWNYSTVKVFLDKNYITKEHIRYQHLAKHSMPCSLLQNHVKKVMELFPREQEDTEHGNMVKNLSKNLTRHWFGSLGSRFRTEIKAFITSDKLTAVSMALKYQDSAEERYSFSGKDGMYMGRLRKATPLKESTYPAYCAILSSAFENLIDLMETFIGPNSELIAVNTDNIVIRKPLSLPGALDAKYRVEKLKSLEKCVSYSYRPLTLNLEPHVIKWNKIENIYKDPNGIARCGSGVYDESQRKIKIGKVILDPIADLESLKGKNLLVIGKAGTGKSVLIKLIVDHTCLVVAPTKTAVANLRDEGINAITFEKAILDKMFDKFRRLIVDEVFMTSLQHQKVLNELKSTGYVLQLFGDPSQTAPVETQGFDVRYDQEYKFAKLVDFNRMDKIYIPKLSRCDPDHFENCEKVLTENKIHPSWRRSDPTIDLTFAFTNDRVREENNKLLPETTHDPEARSMWYVGMRIICDRNEGDICNNRMYRISSINDNMISVTDYHSGKVISGEYKKSLFKRAFSITIHSCQCMTITEKFRIVEIHKMRQRVDLLYTALTRARHSWQVHIEDQKGLLDWTFTRPRVPIVSVQGPILDWTGLIYRNVNHESKKVYVGQVKDFPKRNEQIRLQEHLECEDKSHSAPGKWESMVIGKVLYHDEYNRKRLDETEKKWIQITQKSHEYEITNDKHLIPFCDRDVNYKIKLKVDAKLFRLDKWFPNDDKATKRWRVIPSEDSGYEPRNFYYNEKKNNKQAKFEEAMKYHSELEKLEAKAHYPTI